MSKTLEQLASERRQRQERETRAARLAAHERHKAEIEAEADRVLAAIDEEAANPRPSTPLEERLSRVERMAGHPLPTIDEIQASYLPEGAIIRKDEIRAAVIRKQERRREAAEEAAGVPRAQRQHDEKVQEIETRLRDRLAAWRAQERDIHAARARELDELGARPTLESLVAA